VTRASLESFAIRLLYHAAAEVVKPGEVFDSLANLVFEGTRNSVPRMGGTEIT
jgi:hypothetical protein